MTNKAKVVIQQCSVVVKMNRIKIPSNLSWKEADKSNFSNGQTNVSNIKVAILQTNRNYICYRTKSKGVATTKF